MAKAQKQSNLGGLEALALGQGGYFDRRDALAYGVDDSLLGYHTRMGRFERVLPGVYRLSIAPISLIDEYLLAWAWTNYRGAISHESALVLFDLADVLPARVHLTVPRPFHRTTAPFQVHLAPLPTDEVRDYYGVRVTSPARSIVDAAATGTDPTQIFKAVREALNRGLVEPDASGPPPPAAQTSIGEMSDDLSRRRCRVPAPERGRTPSGFRKQLLQRLRNEAFRAGIAAQRLQQRVAFERLLARLSPDGDWVLKGGFALELRYDLNTRPTRDMDLRTPHAPAAALDDLRRTVAGAAAIDHFSFEHGEIAQELQGAPGGSLRVRVVAQVAGFVLTTFHVDISSGDALVDPPDILQGSDLLQFAGIRPIEFPVYPVPQHLAEKLHAYTLPRLQENTHVRDLIDLIAIVTIENVESHRLARAVEATFASRATHPIPNRLVEPPASWEQPFAVIAAEAAILPSTDLREGHALAAQFWNPFLKDRATDRLWSADQRHWSPASNRPPEA